MATTQTRKNRVNKALSLISRKFHDKIPLSDIIDILLGQGLMIVDEEGENWQGMLLGRDSYTRFDVVDLENDRKLTKVCLNLSWYKHDTGRYEINSYLG